MKKLTDLSKQEAEDFLRGNGFQIPITPKQVEMFEQLYPNEYPFNDNPFKNMVEN